MSPKKPLVWAEINLKHLRHNLNAIRRFVGPRTEVLAVVKADAYGHGMRAVAKALAKEGVGFFGVANIDEATELRKICPMQKILTLGSVHPTQVKDYIRYRITPTLSCREDADQFEKYLKNSPKKWPVHVKIDTGMGRLGVWHEEALDLFKTILKTKHLEIEGVYTHFANADHADRARTLKQIQHFQYLLEVLKELGVRPRYVHSANSMGLARFRSAHLNLVRPGIILYGINPTGEKLPIALKPVLSLKTRVALIKEVSKGRAVSYGSTYHTLRKTKIAVLPIGYSHGFRVGYSNKAEVLIGGKRYPVVGRVTMDQTLVDLGPDAPVRRWDEVFLLGPGLTANELAKHVDTIPYEILCSIHSRIPRI